MMSDKSPVVMCRACGACFDHESWPMLVLVERIEPDEVKRMLVDWPSEHCIEVRRCRRCAREVAAQLQPCARRGAEGAPSGR